MIVMRIYAKKSVDTPEPLTKAKCNSGGKRAFRDWQKLGLLRVPTSVSTDFLYKSQ